MTPRDKHMVVIEDADLADAWLGVSTAIDDCTELQNLSAMTVQKLVLLVAFGKVRERVRLQDAHRSAFTGDGER